LSIKGVVFDKDGTLLDYNKTWVPVNRIIASLIANGNKDVIAQMLSESGQDDVAGTVSSGSLLAIGNNDQIAEAWQKYAPHHDVETIAELINNVGKSAATFTAKPVIKLQETVLKLAKEGLKMGLATSDSYDGAIETLSPFNILDHFDFICGYDSGYGVKPGSGMVLGFCEETGVDPSEVVVVGDNAHDMEMAMAANVILRVGVLTGTSSEQELKDMADVVIPSISDLNAIIDQFNAGEQI
jgi:phosphoglycolate phosphatase